MTLILILIYHPLYSKLWELLPVPLYRGSSSFSFPSWTVILYCLWVPASVRCEELLFSLVSTFYYSIYYWFNFCSLVKKLRTSNDVWAGALLWCINDDLTPEDRQPQESVCIIRCSVTRSSRTLNTNSFFPLHIPVQNWIEVAIRHFLFFKPFSMGKLEVFYYAYGYKAWSLRLRGNAG